MIVSAEQEIRNNNEVVSRFIVDFTNLHTWQNDVLDIALLTPEPIRNGTYVNILKKVYNHKVPYTYKVVEFIPDSKFKLKRDKPYKIEITYFIDKIEDQISKVKIREKIELKGLMILLKGFIYLSTKRKLKKCLVNLNEILG